MMQLPIIRHNAPKYNITKIVDNQINFERQFICYLTPHSSSSDYWFTTDIHLLDLTIEFIYKFVVDEWNISTINNQHSHIKIDNPIDNYCIIDWHIRPLPSYESSLYSPNYSVLINTIIQ